MPKRFTLLLPVLYALIGSFLWFEYGVGYVSIALWLLLQVFIFFIYRWLISDKSLGLMLKFHLSATAAGMLILFYVIFPWRGYDDMTQLVMEFILMGFGTFCCSVGVFSLIYMIIRKLIADSRN